MNKILKCYDIFIINVNITNQFIVYLIILIMIILVNFFNIQKLAHRLK